MYKETMGNLSIEDIIKATGGEVLYRNSDSFRRVSIDSRTLKEGQLFIALKGSRFDGHDFLDDALNKGSGAIVSIHLEKHLKEKTIIHVPDTLKALQNIAHFIRLKRDIPVVGVTGSNGKTTTKELIASILGTKYRVLKNRGNLNNHIGLPLSLIELSDEDEVVVLEMGASGPGEIKELCEIAVPGYGVLTNISQTHLEGFKDIETIRKTKLELLEFAGVAVVNADDSFMMEGIRMSGFKGRQFRYGIKNDAEICAKNIELLEKGSIFTLHIENKAIEINSKISGIFNIYNILAAVSVGHLFSIDLLSMKNAVDSFKGVPMRLEVKEIKGIKFISDVYNANPASMEGAIRELVRTGRGRKIVALGDMLELGLYAEDAHRRLGRLLSELTVDILIAVGPFMAFAASEFKGSTYKLGKADEAGKILKEICKKGDTVLIKGSRGMNMERVLEEYAI
ncbi:MAG: UDP-N-acetylmuramoyl-tripeptide--D-alanyl-D-alanine ligase [Nitrospirae bacterium]|nr:UDP-N-acetylmuramoyl-tripeptide--D-alanyl-D-alanine ligase [Nitrospirota bacterium]